MLGCEGEEHAITSDDIFWRQQAPGKTLVVGASYVALECAGFLTAMGYDVTVVIRSVVLRGFDQDCGNRVLEYMKKTGTKVVRSAVLSKISSRADGKLDVSWVPKNPRASETHLVPPGSAGSGTFDTVLSAIGRYADTSGLGLENVGIQTVGRGNFIPVDAEERTTVSSIYCLGDAAEGLPELTPVAIQTGLLLANRLVGGAKKLMDYTKVATTVFTPLEYGTVGVTEDDVLESDGSDVSQLAYSDSTFDTYRGRKLRAGVAVYRKFFQPLEWTIVHHRQPTKCYMKIIVDENDAGRLLGVHYCGPNAGEIMQAFSLALRLGATFDDLKDTVGIHPTSVERFCIMKDADKGELASFSPEAKERAAAAAAAAAAATASGGGGFFKFDVGAQQQQAANTFDFSSSFGAPAGAAAPCDT